ncbi:MAG: glycoside hydrolase family 130 protein [Eubacteriales bacterium]|nr:glycoside hydrolase family 130 protein [Eubacteriales bacterium]
MSRVEIIGNDLPNIPWQDRKPGDGSVVWRYDGNPILGWNHTKNCARIYNSAVVPWKGAYAGVFRADHKDGLQAIHRAFSKDAIHWDVDNEPIQWIDENGDPYQPSYAYDPRVTEIDGVYYVTWCTGFGGGPALGLGRTTDFETFVRMENPTTPYNRNGVLFPRKVNGNYVLLTRPSDNGHTAFGDIFLSESPDLIYWGKHRKVMSSNDMTMWQRLKIGAGPVPIETSEGWLLIYHGVLQSCNGYIYSFGAALLDRDDPSKVLFRTREYLLTPEVEYETVGFVPNVAFPCATLCDAATGRIAIYYGGADTYVAIAFAQIDELIEAMKNDSQLMPGDSEAIR